MVVWSVGHDGDESVQECRALKRQDEVWTVGERACKEGDF